MSVWKRLFLDHPKKVEEGYLEHFRFASRIGFICLKCGIKAMIHSVVPAWFEYDASLGIKEMAKMIEGRSDDGNKRL